jgi:hypothetical protein
MNWSSNPVITLLVGFLLGLLAEPLKQSVNRWLQGREARRRVYDDLGGYLGRVEALSLLHRLDLLLWNEVISVHAPNFDYYIAHEPGVLLRADTDRGVYKLVERLRGLGTAYQDVKPVLPTGGTNDSLPQTFLRDVLSRYQELLSGGSLNRGLLLSACQRRRQPIANARRPLLIPTVPSAASPRRRRSHSQSS